MNLDRVYVGRLQHAGNGEHWDRFRFIATTSEEILLHNVISMVPHIENSRAAFALLGMIMAFPATEVKLTLFGGPADHHVGEIEISPPHSHEADFKRAAEPPSGCNAMPEEGDVESVAVGIQPIPNDEMPVYRFQVFRR